MTYRRTALSAVLASERLLRWRLAYFITADKAVRRYVNNYYFSNMETISNTVWQRKGSSIVFDQQSLGPFIADGSVISLRQMLSWASGLPADPPVPGRTIVVSGLETMMDTQAAQDAEDFLARRIRPLLIAIQHHWDNCGVVFGFAAHSNAFKETTMEEEVLFQRRDKKQIRLSEGLWDGSVTINLRRLAREGDTPGSEIITGYYVARIS